MRDYRISFGNGQVLELGSDLKAARRELETHRSNGYARLQFFDPGTADDPGDWFNLKEKANG